MCVCTIARISIFNMVPILFYPVPVYRLPHYRFLATPTSYPIVRLVRLPFLPIVQCLLSAYHLHSVHLPISCNTPSPDTHPNQSWIGLLSVYIHLIISYFLFLYYLLISLCPVMTRLDWGTLNPAIDSQTKCTTTTLFLFSYNYSCLLPTIQYLRLLFRFVRLASPCIFSEE